MRKLLIAFLLLTGSATSAVAQLSFSLGISSPGVRIGINLPVYPDLVPVPGYPVYYAPGLSLNFFFYDGLYWVYQDDNWYASAWYNGPWDLVEPYYVPVYILRIPVRYYRVPPPYFRHWHADRPPRWGERWGHEWERHRSGWDQSDRSNPPPLAPLPLYQRGYSGERYPHAEQQQQLRREHYPYRPHDELVRERDRERHDEQGPAMRERPDRPPALSPRMQRDEDDRPAPPRLGPSRQRAPAEQDERPPMRQREFQREMPMPRPGSGPGRPRDNDEDRGHGRRR